MAAWAQLRQRLLELETEDGPLLGYPDPRGDDQTPPYHITLAPWAMAEAEALRREFGAEVVLTVGALGYPDPSIGPVRRVTQHASRLDPAEVSVALDGPARVASGHTVMQCLLITNHRDEELVLITNGQLTADVVDRDTGEEVGGYAGAQRLSRREFRVSPAATVRVPLHIGTASYTPRLGYAVPAGLWGLTVELVIDATGQRRTPMMDLTITE
jgi:hypothetical protein